MLTKTVNGRKTVKNRNFQTSKKTSLHIPKRHLWYKFQQNRCDDSRVNEFNRRPRPRRTTDATPHHTITSASNTSWAKKQTLAHHPRKMKKKSNLEKNDISHFICLAIYLGININWCAISLFNDSWIIVALVGYIWWYHWSLIFLP